MSDRSKLLIHVNRIHGILDRAIREGPDGSLEGKFAAEQPFFVHYGCAFYLSGCLAFLEGEDGSYSWDSLSAFNQDFDQFLADNPAPPKPSYIARGISKASMMALACIRNAIVHHNGDLAKNRDKKSVAMVATANMAGVILNGSVVTLEAPFHDFVRLSTLAVRNYYGEF